MTHDQPPQPVQIFYDGECPFCTRYAHMVRLRQAVGPVQLIDVREPHPDAERLAAGRYSHLTDPQTGQPFASTAAPLDFDKGYAVVHAGRLYTGADALHHIARLTTPVGVLNRLNAWVFASPARARALYPSLRAARNAILGLMGKPKWKDSRPAAKPAE